MACRVVMFQRLANLLQQSNHIKQRVLHTPGRAQLQGLAHLLLEVGVGIQFGDEGIEKAGQVGSGVDVGVWLVVGKGSTSLAAVILVVQARQVRHVREGEELQGFFAQFLALCSHLHQDVQDLLAERPDRHQVKVVCQWNRRPDPAPFRTLLTNERKNRVEITRSPLRTDNLLKLPIPADERVSRTVVCQPGFVGTLKLRNDAVGQYLSKLDAPLVERVNVPDGALNKDFMLVERNQLAQRLRRQPRCKNGVRWTVALEGA